MKQRQILYNALSTLAQVIGSAAALFFLYRFLIRTIGIDRLGIWSLVLAAGSVMTLANQGFSTSIVKFVAKYAARENSADVSALIQTAIISVGLAVAALSAGLYPIAKWVLAAVVPRAHIAETLAILPFALISLWLDILEGILQAGLAGHELITLCNSLELGGAASYLLLAFILVPVHGLLGLAWAQTFQCAALVIVTWFLLRRRVPQLPPIPLRWNRSLFREMTSYGVHFQLITAAQALREPVTKTLLTRFGGLAYTGFYDLAYRWVFTFRELIAQSNQVLVPTVSRLHESDPKAIPAVYRESYRLIFYLSVPAFASLVVLSPLVSRVWIGRHEPIFVTFVAILAAGWLVNILANPSYVVDLGTGALRWVTVGCLTTAVLNAGLGFLAGHLAGGFAVVGATAFSLATGYLVILVAYHREHRVSFRELLPNESGMILGPSVIGALLFLPFLCASPAHSLLSLRLTLGSLAALLLMAFIPMWRHPMRKRLVRWVFSRVPA